MTTKEKIMNVSLRLFSQRGYEATSIRDICGEVGVKESTLYYHFKNKQDILDSLIAKFEDHISELLKKADISGENKIENNGIASVDSYMMDSYLFDPFCNLMLRLLMMEQFHNETMRELYERFMFTQPYEIQKNIMDHLVRMGMISHSQAKYITQEMFSFMTVLTYKYLLNGELTEERKTAYAQELHDFYNEFFLRFSRNMRGENNE